MSLADQLHTMFIDLDRRDAYSGVVLVTRGETTEYEGAFGFANRAWHVRNTMDTRFDTASITKLFTTAAVLQMIDAGHFGLDTRVVEYLDLHDTSISPAVSVFHLLTHSSGIGDDADEEAGERYEDVWRDRPNYSVIETRDFLAQFVRKPANFAPGQGCRYNNVGFVLLGLCIEHASRQTFRDYIREHVFGATGMNRSGFFRMDEVADQVAEGADPVIDEAGNIVRWKRNIYSQPPIGSPDSGAHTTAGDLGRFLRAARTGQLFSEDSTERFLAPYVHHSATDTTTHRYGLCLEHVSSRSGTPMFIQKDGYNVGVSGIVRYYPADDITVILLSNTSDGVWQPVKDIHAAITARRN